MTIHQMLAITLAEQRTPRPEKASQQQHQAEEHHHVKRDVMSDAEDPGMRGGDEHCIEEVVLRQVPDKRNDQDVNEDAEDGEPPLLHEADQCVDLLDETLLDRIRHAVCIET